MNWNQIIEYEKKKKYFINIKKFLWKEYKKKKIIYPKKKNIFKAFKITKFSKIKVVILGQDPYIKEKQAHGLAFSVPKQVKITPSLINIYKEIKYEFPKFKIPKHGCLIKWAKQGVLLLNNILTVEKNKTNSHKNIGWHIFTNRIVQYINYYIKSVVFMLWGKQAQEKIKFINKNKHLILTTSHPSPFSFNKGFYGCNHFKKTNIFLIKKKILPIKW